MRRRRTALVSAFVVASVLSGCTGAPSAPIPPSVAPRPSGPSPTTQTVSPSPIAGWWRPAAGPETLASGLAAPWSVIPVPSGGALLSQRDDGAVLELDPGGALRVVGHVPGVVSGGESGLHGLALLDSESPWLYAYLGTEHDNRVVRMPLTGEPGGFALGAPEVVVSGIARARTHNGGRIAFGPDGLLYVATGDAGEPSRAQDTASLNGKILRVTAEGDPAPGNPFGTAVYSWGHRNVQGMAWTSDGVMWASEFGQNTWDELNRIEQGANYGWPQHEGRAEADGFVDPVVSWATSDASPSGIAAMGDSLFVAGLRGEVLWIVDTVDGALSGEPVAALRGEQGRLRDAVAAPDGSLWVLTNNTDGRGGPRAGDDLLLRLPLQPSG